MRADSARLRPAVLLRQRVFDQIAADRFCAGQPTRAARKQRAHTEHAYGDVDRPGSTGFKDTGIAVLAHGMPGKNATIHGDVNTGSAKRRGSAREAEVEQRV